MINIITYLIHLTRGTIPKMKHQRKVNNTELPTNRLLPKGMPGWAFLPYQICRLYLTAISSPLSSTSPSPPVYSTIDTIASMFSIITDPVTSTSLTSSSAQHTPNRTLLHLTHPMCRQGLVCHQSPSPDNYDTSCLLSEEDTEQYLMAGFIQ